MLHLNHSLPAFHPRRCFSHRCLDVGLHFRTLMFILPWLPPSADVWALGCILHELCTRRPLFLPRGRPSDAEIRGRVLEGKVTPISRK